MERQKNYIVYLCYGYERVFHECSYSLLSLSRLYAPEDLDNTEIWIYTDKPEWFSAYKGCRLPLHYRRVDDGLIKQWRGAINFVHRVKIETLKDLAACRKGNILYVDTDTVFTHRIDKILEGIDKGKLYMHTMESIVREERNPIMAKLNRYLQKEKKIIKECSLRDMAMWNAGVLGFNTGHHHLLDDVLAFTDAEYPKFPKHVVEQFAFSVYFQLQDKIKAASPYIFHYWNLKEAGIILSSFFHHFKDRKWDDLVALAALVQLPDLLQEKVNFLSNRTLPGQITKKKWQPVMPDWGIIATQV